jgi:hypothetical protein
MLMPAKNEHGRIALSDQFAMGEYWSHPPKPYLIETTVYVGIL